MPNFAFTVKTSANREANTIKLTMGDQSHGTFNSLEELLRYAARVKTGRIVLIPGLEPDGKALKIVSEDIKNQVRKLRKQGFK